VASRERDQSAGYARRCRPLRYRGRGFNSRRLHLSQRIRTALRTSGGRFFYEGQGIQARDGTVERPADVGGDELEPDLAKQSAKRWRRTRRPLLQNFLQVAEPVLDPLNRRRAEDPLAAPAQCVNFVGQLSSTRRSDSTGN